MAISYEVKNVKTIRQQQNNNNNEEINIIFKTFDRVSASIYIKFYILICME